MKCISLWQPWASYIAGGAKRIETRHWATKYRGPILIHAAQRKSECTEEQKKTFPFGAIVARAVLVDCVPTEELRHQISELEYNLGNYDNGRYGWVLENIQALNAPIPYKGMQGLFEVTTASLLACGEPLYAIAPGHTPDGVLIK